MQIRINGQISSEWNRAVSWSASTQLTWKPIYWNQAEKFGLTLFSLSSTRYYSCLLQQCNQWHLSCKIASVRVHMMDIVVLFEVSIKFGIPSSITPSLCISDSFNCSWGPWGRFDVADVSPNVVESTEHRDHNHRSLGIWNESLGWFLRSNHRIW